MNVLFALHHTLACNSASHVDGIARELCHQGYDCLIAVPFGLEDASRFDPYPYQVATFEQVLKAGPQFQNGRGIDVFHSWTPRECMRKFHAKVRAVAGDFQTIIHLEDNEEHIAKSEMGEELFDKARDNCLPFEFPNHLTHPLLHLDFFREAKGATVLIDKLAEHVPHGLPTAAFWPAVDAEIWRQRPRNDAMRNKLGIRDDEIVLTYHGNTHIANFREVRSLYLAVALLNREGTPTRLVRVGTQSVETSPEYQEWADKHTISLGYIVDRRELSDVLAMADMYVQPGTADPFNDYRFPSKLPEFFAMGRPVILPKTNIGSVTKHLSDAYVLDHADGSSIYKAVQHIASDKALYQTLSDGALQFSKDQFSWKKSAQTVQDLYARCLNRPQRAAA